LIHRRVRQHSLVILDPSEIAGIKPSTAPVAFEEVLALVKWWSADALADPGHAAPLNKNLAPGIASKADLIAHSMKVRRLMFRFDGRY
jgi:hypothetical protein